MISHVRWWILLKVEEIVEAEDLLSQTFAKSEVHYFAADY